MLHRQSLPDPRGCAALCRASKHPRRHHLALLAASAAAAIACSSATEDVAPAPPPSFDGVYRVSGTSVEIEGGASRDVSGLVVLRQEGSHYRTNFDLETEYKVGADGEGDGMSASLIGEGTGRIDGAALDGTASTQFVLAIVPGVHADFALLPRRVGPRITSTTSARMRSDGSIAIEIESRPEPGEAYSATRTELLGVRVGDVGSPGELAAVQGETPPVSAPPP